MGKGAGIAMGHEYYGSCAQVICLKSPDTLWAVSNGDTVIFQGPIHRADADADGKSILTTTIGTIHFYWGASSQLVSSVLDGLKLDLGTGTPVVVPMPRFANCCYAILIDCDFGQQVTPPTLKWELSRIPTVLTLDSHTLDANEDINVFEVLWEILTDQLIGLGLDPTTHLDSASFTACAVQIATEGLGVSVLVDSTSSFRELTGKILQYVDGFLYWRAGVIYAALIRQGIPTGTPTLTVADMLDEPVPDNTEFRDTWNFTAITFKELQVVPDPNNDGQFVTQWNQTDEGYDDPANADIIGRSVIQTFDFPWVTDRAVAKKIADRIGTRGGVPAVTWKLKLKPKWQTLKPGDVMYLTYSKFGIDTLLMRVTEVERGDPMSPEVTVTVLEEWTRDMSGDYLPADTDFVPPAVDSTGSYKFALATAAPRCMVLPVDLKAGEVDGWLLAVNRPTPEADRVRQWFNCHFPEGLSAYVQIGGTTRAFPWAAELLHFRPSGSNWILRLRIPVSYDAADFTLVWQAADDIYLVTGRRTVDAKRYTDVHQLLGMWGRKRIGGYFTVLAPGIFDVEVTFGDYSTQGLVEETLAAVGEIPTAALYFGRMDQFVVEPTSIYQFERTGVNYDGDVEKYRSLRAPVGNFVKSQALTDGGLCSFDRSVTTMNPAGTYSPDWGARVPSASEVLDVHAGLVLANVDDSAGAILWSDMDDVLGRVATDDSETAVQRDRWAWVDTGIGNMLDSGNQTLYDL